MRAGKLNSRIEIQEKTGVRNTIGQLEDKWVTKAKLWANIRVLSGMEVLKSNVEISKINLSVMIRRNLAVKAGMRVIHGEFIYEILAVQHNQVSKDSTMLVCKGLDDVRKSTS